jgi:CBS domain-containing protein
MKVKNLMTKEVACVRRSDPASAAVQIMWECDCGSVPVKEDDSERVVGMITDRDICVASWSRDCSPSTIPVSEAASKKLYACSPDDSVAAVQELMSRRQVRRVPVLDKDGHLLGIVSLADIATEARKEDTRAGASELSPTELVSTLRTICTPRPGDAASAIH